MLCTFVWAMGAIFDLLYALLYEMYTHRKIQIYIVPNNWAVYILEIEIFPFLWLRVTPCTISTRRIQMNQDVLNSWRKKTRRSLWTAIFSHNTWMQHPCQMKRGKVLFLGTVCAAFLQIRRIKSSVQLSRHEHFITEQWLCLMTKWDECFCYLDCFSSS